ncbi:hypothetical protein CQA57_05670 [Helicobacter anseris]|uniref:BspA family leucine-rich repeat surface protein n=1 Tax=Helicobacter anseris TaxID=375926 RepID=A0A3D8J6A7_9HELI|nr:BspA family leucine-rich repeat surface protein [Helicobacter anseris]RDU73013.1 hypothetical protein CQA57_05670 [Helicobacter anseris]
MKYTPKTKKELKTLCNDLSINLGDIDTSLITDMSQLFLNTERMNFSGIENWNVSNVEDMRGMFYGCNSFTSDLSKWDTNKVIDMAFMFCDCNSFNADLSNWNVSNVEDMSYMFFHCKNFTSDLSRWNVSNVENMRGMFDDIPGYIKPNWCE